MSLARMGSVAGHRNVFGHSSNGGRVWVQPAEIFSSAALGCAIGWHVGRESDDVERKEAALAVVDSRLMRLSHELAASCAHSMRHSLSSAIATFFLPIQLKYLSPIILFISSPCSCQILSPIAGAFGRRPGRNDLHAVKRAKVRHGSVSVETSTKPREFHGAASS